MNAFTKTHPYSARLIERHPLTPGDSTKQVYHVTLDLSSAPFPFTIGDSIGIWAPNPEEEIRLILEAIGAGGDEIIESRFGEKPLKQLLTHHLNLGQPTKKMMLWAEKQTLSPEKAIELQQIIHEESGKQKEFLQSYFISDFLTDFGPYRQDLSGLVEACLPLMPRFYSIASSPILNPAKIDLLVADVRYQHRGKERSGVASAYLCHDMPLGGVLSIFLQEAPHFRLPSTSTPIILIGPGTGIAPYRGFLQERKKQNAAKNWLFFGEQHEKSGFFYRDELESLVAQSDLRLSLAFSRDQEEKIYVQHRMWEERDELWRWIQEGAHIFVCGDAHHMAKDVEETLIRLVEEKLALSYLDATHHVRAWRKEGRYNRDVY